jgi:hypothetical protein
MKRILKALPIALGLSLLYTGIAYAQGETPPEAAAQGGEIAAKLAALVAAATLVERIVEMFWDFIENNILSARKLLSNVNDYEKWARNQVNTARKALINAADKDANKDKLSELENALRSAESRLSDYLKSDAYISNKKKWSFLISMALGLVVAGVTKLQMFAMLGMLPSVEAKFLQALFFNADVIITGLVIGTGSAPVHSLIGLLQNTKNAVDAARALYTGKAIAEVQQEVQSLQQGAEPRRTKAKEAVKTPETSLDAERRTRRMLKV